MYLLDNDIFSDYRRQKGRNTALVQRIEAELTQGRVFICDITVEEAVGGALRVVNTKRTLKDWPGMFAGYRLLALAIADIAEFPRLEYDQAAESLVASWTDGYKKKASFDMRVAACAVSRGLILVTRNQDDFRKVPQIQLDDWT